MLHGESTADDDVDLEIALGADETGSKSRINIMKMGDSFGLLTMDMAATSHFNPILDKNEFIDFEIDWSGLNLLVKRKGQVIQAGNANACFQVRNIQIVDSLFFFKKVQLFIFFLMFTCVIYTFLVFTHRFYNSVGDSMNQYILNQSANLTRIFMVITLFFETSLY